MTLRIPSMSISILFEDGGQHCFSNWPQKIKLGVEEGWYDGASIAFAVFLVIIVTAISDYHQSLWFQNLNKEKRNIQLEVMRGGKTVKISIFGGSSKYILNKVNYL
ncbi:hypothetical protein LWI29_029579 [Acer saccharum]|uniref:Uncharacterized protein n=1 Tax=Acer saccharum TaxID=4024 RepID=A0AA39VT99_ACESA|nr:hypothetical protein LWI29_029579 [Acer saccharum]